MTFSSPQFPAPLSPILRPSYEGLSFFIEKNLRIEYFHISALGILYNRPLKGDYYLIQPIILICLTFVKREKIGKAKTLGDLKKIDKKSRCYYILAADL